MNSNVQKLERDGIQDEQEFICPIKRKCKEDIKVVGYLIMEVIVNTTGLKLETYEKVSKR